jgi:hypothetical protein
MTYLSSHLLDEFPGVASPSAARLGSEIDEVVTVIVSGTHDLELGVMQQRHQLVIKSFLAFGGQLVVQSPHSGAQQGQPVVQVLPWACPVDLEESVLVKVMLHQRKML